MQVPLLSGVLAGPAAEFIQSFPINLEPVAVPSESGNGISRGQFRAPAGAHQIGTGPGSDRGGIVWNNRMFRVMGSKLVEISAAGSVIVIGDVGDDGNRCALDYSFDRLIIGSNGNLFYFDGTTLVQVTDEDLGTCVDAIWIDGYTMSTDGQYVVVTELNDPTSVKPLKYGSAESDPDDITGLIRYRDEAYVLGRNTIELFKNVGGSGFPFQTVKGGVIPFGCVGPRAKCLFGDGFAFVGSDRGGSLNVYAGGQGVAQPFGNRALCQALQSVADCKCIELEQRSYGGEIRLLIHLPGETWVFLVNASKGFGEPVWFRLQGPDGAYNARNATEWSGRLIVGGDNGEIAELTETESAVFGIEHEWQFDAGMLYNQGLGAIVDSAELVGLPGRGTGKGSVFMSMTRDGESFSPERAITIEPGQRSKRLQWRPHARMGNYIGFRFRGVGAALPAIAALEVKARPLSA